MVQCDESGVKEAAGILERGGVIVFPTDTVYGIGCDPYNEKAVKTIYKIKGRDMGKLLPVLGFSKGQLEEIAEFNEIATKIANKFWPGGVTLLLKIKDQRLKTSLMLTDKIAVRVPANQCILSVLKRCKYIVGTSANISGVSAFTDPNKCYQNITDFDLFLNGGTIKSKGESTIVDATKEVKIIREGGVSREEIMNAL